MNKSLGYLTVRSLINKIKRALKKPGTYAGLAFVVLYGILIVVGLGSMVEEYGMNNPSGLAALLSLLMFYTQPMTIIQYAKRKGVVFRQCDVHFIFAAPENPKLVLLHAGMKNFLMNLIIAAVIMILGIGMCGISVPRMVAYGLFMIVVENLLEMALMIACYGNEVLPDQFFVVFKWVLYGMMVLFLLAAVYMFWKHG